MVQSKLGMLVIVQPREAKTQILEAFRRHGANGEIVAAKLGVSRRCLSRWVTRLELGDSLAKMRARAEREGWYRHQPGAKKGGRPVGAKDSQPRQRKKGDEAAA